MIDSLTLSHFIQLVRITKYTKGGEELCTCLPSIRSFPGPDPECTAGVNTYFSSFPWLQRSDSKRYGMFSHPWPDELPGTFPKDLVGEKLRALGPAQGVSFQNLTTNPPCQVSCCRCPQDQKDSLESYNRPKSCQNWPLFLVHELVKAADLR